MSVMTTNVFNSDIFLSPIQACRKIFPFIHFGTIQSWIRDGLITPVEVPNRPSGPGSGAKLDIADLTTIGIVYSMLRLGATHKRLKADEVNRSDVFLFHEPSEKKKTGFRKAVRPPNMDASGRLIQEYLMKHNFHVTVHLSPYVPVIPRAIVIDFYPTSESEQYGWLWERLDTYQEVVGHSYINCKTWHDFVGNRL
jgi:hypothetical protein